MNGNGIWMCYHVWHILMFRKENQNYHRYVPSVTFHTWGAKLYKYSTLSWYTVYIFFISKFKKKNCHLCCFWKYSLVQNTLDNCVVDPPYETHTNVSGTSVEALQKNGNSGVQFFHYYSQLMSVGTQKWYCVVLAHTAQWNKPVLNIKHMVNLVGSTKPSHSQTLFTLGCVAVTMSTLANCPWLKCAVWYVLSEICMLSPVDSTWGSRAAGPPATDLC